MPTFVRRSDYHHVEGNWAHGCLQLALEFRLITFSMHLSDLILAVAKFSRREVSQARECVVAICHPDASQADSKYQIPSHEVETASGPRVAVCTAMALGHDGVVIPEVARLIGDNQMIVDKFGPLNEDDVGSEGEGVSRAEALYAVDTLVRMRELVNRSAMELAAIVRDMEYSLEMADIMTVDDDDEDDAAAPDDDDDNGGDCVDASALMAEVDAAFDAIVVASQQQQQPHHEDEA